MAGISADYVELPDISILRQLCRAELAARLDSVSVIIIVCCSYLDFSIYCV